MLFIIELLSVVLGITVVASWIISGITGTIGCLILNHKWTVVHGKDYLTKEQLHGLFCSLCGGWFTFYNFIDYSCDPTVTEIESVKKYGFISL